MAQYLSHYKNPPKFWSQINKNVWGVKSIEIFTVVFKMHYSEKAEY
jgi:hypothetical protein